eukprot:5371753-Pleurochrysis_carterae.AAC.1
MRASNSHIMADILSGLLIFSSTYEYKATSGCVMQHVFAVLVCATLFAANEGVRILPRLDLAATATRNRHLQHQVGPTAGIHSKFKAQIRKQSVAQVRLPQLRYNLDSLEHIQSVLWTM